MITLNADKQLIRVTSLEEIHQRPGFTGSLDPTRHELKAILGRYVFRDMVRCGLSNCHTPHGRGYIVVTTDGLETNIGKDCGRKHFGVDFEDMSRKFDRDITEKENREALWSFFYRLPDLIERITSIRKGGYGADWVYKMSQSLIELNRGCPQSVVRCISEMLKTGSNTAYLMREATVKEVAIMEASAGKRLRAPQYVRDELGHLAGLEALSPENNLRTILALDLTQNLSEFEKLDIDTLTHHQLATWVKYANEVEPKLEKAVASVEAGRRLLTGSNLGCLRPLAEADDLSEFEGYLHQLPG
ncbi:hypothetical protein CFM90_16040 [Ralstonia solanacearum]|nr:hypothetical protein CFM90_16040 [Ralstonia solanacearum]